MPLLKMNEQTLDPRRRGVKLNAGLYASSTRQSMVSSSSNSLLSRQSLLLAFRKIAFGQPLARVVDLDNVDVLLERHDREGDYRQGPGNEAVHFVCAVRDKSVWAQQEALGSNIPSHFHSTSRPGVGE